MGYKIKEKIIDYKIKILGKQENEKRLFHVAECYLLDKFHLVKNKNVIEKRASRCNKYMRYYQRALPLSYIKFLCMISVFLFVK